MVNIHNRVHPIHDCSIVVFASYVMMMSEKVLFSFFQIAGVYRMQDIQSSFFSTTIFIINYSRISSCLIIYNGYCSAVLLTRINRTNNGYVGGMNIHKMQTKEPDNYR